VNQSLASSVAKREKHRQQQDESNGKNKKARDYWSNYMKKGAE
jgi:hypothetical protein